MLGEHHLFGETDVHQLYKQKFSLNSKLHSLMGMNGNKEEESQCKAEETREEVSIDVTPRREGKVPPTRLQEPISETSRRKAEAYLYRTKKEETNKAYFDFVTEPQTIYGKKKEDRWRC